MSDNEDFEEQIRLEEEERKKRAPAESSTSRTRRDDDGTEYEWNEQRQAWFPKIDQDTIVQYQMSYGGGNQQDQAQPAPLDTNSAEYREWYQKYMEYVQQFADKQAKGETPEDATAGMSEQDKANYEYWQKYYAYWYQQPQNSEGANTTAVNSAQPNQQEKPENAAVDGEKDDPKKKKKKKPAETPAVWFEAGEVHTPGVYVSNLPTDITEDEFKELMNKCGLIAFDSLTRKLKLKLYKDANGQLKGDGWCCYIKNESVELALQILDGYDVRGKTIQVEKAKYEMKGNFDPTKKKRKLTSKEKQKIKAKQEKLFDWRPDAPVVGTRQKHERVVILKNLFTPEEFDNDPQKLNDIREDIRSECSKFGEVKKVVVYDHNTDGVAAVTMKEPEEADLCIQALHTRWFAGRRILAENWDGKTKYLVEETEEEKKKRIAQWENFLEEDERMKRLREEAEAKLADVTASVPQQDVESDNDLEGSDSDDNTPANDSVTNSAVTEVTGNAPVSSVDSK